MKLLDGNYDVLTDVHTLHSPWGNTQLATRLLLRRALLMQEPVWQPGWSSVPDVIASGVSKAVVGECVLSRKHSRFCTGVRLRLWRRTGQGSPEPFAYLGWFLGTGATTKGMTAVVSGKVGNQLGGCSLIEQTPELCLFPWLEAMRSFEVA